MSEVGAADKYRLERVEFREWLGLCAGHGFRHGSELVHAFGKAGIADNVYEADKTLKAASELGWIQSSGCAPTTEQQFFGVGSYGGSMSWRKAKRQRDSAKPTSGYNVFQEWNARGSMHGYEPGPNNPFQNEVHQVDDGEVYCAYRGIVICDADSGSYGTAGAVLTRVFGHSDEVSLLASAGRRKYLAKIRTTVGEVGMTVDELALCATWWLTYFLEGGQIADLQPLRETLKKELG